MQKRASPWRKWQRSADSCRHFEPHAPKDEEYERRDARRKKGKGGTMTQTTFMETQIETTHTDDGQCIKTINGAYGSITIDICKMLGHCVHDEGSEKMMT